MGRGPHSAASASLIKSMPPRPCLPSLPEAREYRAKILSLVISGSRAESLRAFDLASYAPMHEIIMVERIVGLRFVDHHSGKTSVHMHYEIVGVVLATGPFGESERLLFGESPCGSAC